MNSKISFLSKYPTSIENAKEWSNLESDFCYVPLPMKNKFFISSALPTYLFHFEEYLYVAYLSHHFKKKMYNLNYLIKKILNDVNQH